MSGRKQRRQQPCESLSNNLQEFCLRILRILSAAVGLLDSAWARLGLVG